MSENNWSQNLKSSWKNILIWGLTVALVALILSLIQPFEYKASMRFTVSQRQFGFNQDAYAAAKSSEKLARNIANTINSRAFLEDIFNSGFGIERSSFSSDEAKMRKAWEKKVSAKTQTETGMLTIEVYDTDKAKALKISEAITYILSTKGADYHGGSRDVQIKRIDDPLVSKWPARPNLPINVIGGLALGVLSALAFYFLRGAPSASDDHSSASKILENPSKPENKKDFFVLPTLPVVKPQDNFNWADYAIPEPLEFIPPMKINIDSEKKVIDNKEKEVISKSEMHLNQETSVFKDEKNISEKLAAILPIEKFSENLNPTEAKPIETLEIKIESEVAPLSENKFLAELKQEINNLPHTQKDVEWKPMMTQKTAELPKSWLFEE